MTRFFAIVALLLALVSVPTAAAVGLTDVAQELRCVTCGTSLDVSNAPAAQEMKARIQRRIDQGASKQEIINEFVHDYGRQVLATPPKKGFDLVAGWLIPLGVLAIAVVCVPFIIRSWNRARRSEPALASTGEPLSDADAERLDREIRDFDGR